MNTEKKTDNIDFNISSYLTNMAEIMPYHRAVVYPAGQDHAGRVAYSHLTFQQLDQESDAIVRKKRPIPSQNLSPKMALTIAITFFAIGLISSLVINLLCFIIAFIDAILLIAYSVYVKRYAGFLGSILMGILIGTSFVYGEAALSGIISVTSFSLSFMSMGNVGGNIGIPGFVQWFSV